MIPIHVITSQNLHLNLKPIIWNFNSHSEFMTQWRKETNEKSNEIFPHLSKLPYMYVNMCI